MSFGYDYKLLQIEFVILFEKLLLEKCYGDLIEIKCHICDHFIVIVLDFFVTASRRVDWQNIHNISISVVHNAFDLCYYFHERISNYRNFFIDSEIL